MKILAIGAHPDDIEIFMFGLLKILKKQNNEIFMSVATDGARGGDVSEKKLKYLRKKESIKALSELGLPHFFNFPDGQLGVDLKHKVSIHELINDIKPNLIITHHKNDYHSDHRALSKLVKSGASHYFPILYCDTMMGLNFNPTYFVDITQVFQLKKKAVLCHKSQNPSRFIDLIKLMNSYRAAQCNSPLGTYAEAYYFEKYFPFSDINKLLPNSPEIVPFHVHDRKGFL